jgi:hypothetical protein
MTAPSVRPWSYRRAMVAWLLALLGTLPACRATHTSISAGLPSKHRVTGDQLSVLSDIKLPKQHPLLKDLEQLREDVSQLLDLPMQQQPVTVYLFADEQRYANYLRAAFPELPPRRAYFVGTSKELAVYTYWGDRVQEDLRHEYTHGVLHACLADVPLWLDEGLAEYFEVVDAPLGWNKDYVERLSQSLANGWKPDLPRLESLHGVAQMQKADYFEAWAWVHFLLESDSDTRQILLDYLHELRTNPSPEVLSARLDREIPRWSDRLLAHVSTLPQNVPATSAIIPASGITRQ